MNINAHFVLGKKLLLFFRIGSFVRDVKKKSEILVGHHRNYTFCRPHAR